MKSMRPPRAPSLLATAAIMASVAAAQAEEVNQTLEEVSVTATRMARSVREVPEAIAVIGAERIEGARMQNIKEAITGTPGVLIDSKNGGYDARLVIRGAGQKAPYGVREITILRDGVPMTDPDSFSRLDFIDVQDIERIEITKGPGSLYGTGSAGGTIQILSKSVFDAGANSVRVGFGNEGAESYHLRHGGWINEKNALALTASRRVVKNHWRNWNEFETNQVGIKHGLMLGDESSIESELSYSTAHLQLPGSMSDAQFETFQSTGEQTDTQDPWKFSGRDSEIWFFNTKLEKKSGDFTFKPRLYFTHWSHFHPVTGVINDSPHNWVYGTDLELHHEHQLLGRSGLTAGVTLRRDDSDGAEKYKYRDTSTVPFGPQAGRITATLSDLPGDRISVEDSVNTLYGVFLQETLRPTDDLTVDIGFRLDRSRFEIDTNETEAYSYATGQYVAGAGESHTETSFTLFSPKLGLSYRMSDGVNVYASVAQSDQVPSSSEIKSNTAIKASTSRNYETGIKARHGQWDLDVAAFINPVTDEIVSTLDNNGQTVFQNAGKTDKKGLELSLTVRPLEGVQVGGGYAYSDFTFDSYQEIVNNAVVDRSGNRMPFIPEHQGSLFAGYRHEAGFKSRIQTEFWGEYFMDNANSEQYGGYDFLTNLMVGYESGPHDWRFNADNLFDKGYAVEVKKDSRGKKSFHAGAPRTLMLTYSYHFPELLSSADGDGS